MLTNQQSTLEFLKDSMVSLTQKIDNKEAEYTSPRKYPRSATPTNTDDFINKTSLDTLSLNTPAHATTPMICSDLSPQSCAT